MTRYITDRPAKLLSGTLIFISGFAHAEERNILLNHPLNLLSDELKFIKYPIGQKSIKEKLTLLF